MPQLKPQPRLAPLGGGYSDAVNFRAQFADGRIGSDPTTATAKAGAEIVECAARALRAELAVFAAEKAH